MKKTVIFTLITFFWLFTFSVSAAVDISGYFENRFYLVVEPDIKWSHVGEKFSLGDYNRLRLILKASPSDKVRVNVALDFFTFHGFITSPLGTYGQTESVEIENLSINLDRVYIDLYFKHFDISIGKQRIALGVSYLWAPLDIFNRVNILEPKEEKPGANAIKMYVPLGASSGIMGVFSPDNNFETSRYALRAKTQVWGVDMGLTLIRSGITRTTVYGLDMRGENFIGWWIEGGIFKTCENNDLKLVLGFDYTFPLGNGLYWLSEFFYDSSGADSIGEYDYELLYSGERFTLGRKYFLSMLNYMFSNLFSVSLSYIANWGDGSYIISPVIRYELGQNIQLAGGFYLPLGQSGGEFNSVPLEEEYQEISPAFFLWLKINF
ncbi:MAG: hypothetical protein KAT17_02025 [Candidatus Aminicenantes bacterium]|nr:hypothetical protein [Candidatus Aminicenantes bacterium]